MILKALQSHMHIARCFKLKAESLCEVLYNTDLIIYLTEERLCSPNLKVIKFWENSPATLNEANVLLKPYLKYLNLYRAIDKLPPKRTIKTKNLECLARLFYNGDIDKNGFWDEQEIYKNIGKHSQSTANHIVTSLHINHRNPLTFGKYIRMVFPDTVDLSSRDMDEFYHQQFNKFNNM